MSKNLFRKSIFSRKATDQRNSVWYRIYLDKGFSARNDKYVKNFTQQFLTFYIFNGKQYKYQIIIVNICWIIKKMSS